MWTRALLEEYKVGREAVGVWCAPAIEQNAAEKVFRSVRSWQPGA